jgi:VanZ family protein
LLHKLKKFRLHIILTSLVIYSLTLVILTSVPLSNAAKSGYIDKIQHFGAYGLLTFILYFAIYFQNQILIFKKHTTFFTMFFAFTFGLLNEIHQLFIPTRTFSKFDLLANLLGSILMVIVINLTLRILKLIKIRI